MTARGAWKRFPSWGALLCVLLLFALAVHGHWRFARRIEPGHVLYAFDDAYIHLSIAAGAAENLSPGSRGARLLGGSSSPLWTFLLALWARAGLPDLDLAPLALNVLAGAALLLWFHRRCLAWGLAGGWLLLAELAMLLVVPLPALAFVGLEHLFHGFAALLFLDALGRDDPSGVATAPAAFLLGALRYESLFLIAASVFFLALRGARRRAAVILAAGVLPLLLHGILLLRCGHGFLPYSIRFKGSFPRGEDFVTELVVYLLVLGAKLVRQHLAKPELLVFTASFLFMMRRGAWDPAGREGAWALRVRVVLLAFLLHLAFAWTHVFLRYEAYLVVMGLYVCTAFLASRAELRVAAAAPRDAAGAVAGGDAAGGAAGRNAADALAGRDAAGAVAGRRWGTVLLVLVVMTPLVARAWRGWARMPDALSDIHEQHFRMLAFLEALPGREAVVANDVGVLSRYAGREIVDVFGLVSPDVARLRLEGRLDAEALDGLARRHGAVIALVYERWLRGPILRCGIPASWSLVGRFTLPRKRTVAGDETVSLFLLDPGRGADAARAFEGLR